jgi:hypothetical protein
MNITGTHAADVWNGLKTIGFSDSDAAQIMGLSQKQTVRLVHGQGLTSLEERHALAAYMSFKRRVTIWAKAHMTN